MTPNADTLIDRIRMKRQLTRWKILGILSVVVAALALLERSLPANESALRHGNYIASYRLQGFISENKQRDELLDTIADSQTAKAFILHIDSPGGTVVGGERLYHQVRKIAKKRPVLVVMHGMATSAAYMTAIAGDRLYAHEGTITGSVGVLLQTADMTGLAEKVGVKPVNFKSAPLKAVPNPFEPLTPEAARATQDVIDDMMRFFTDLVKERRKLDEKSLAIITDGRIFTGRQALALNLVDALGDERDALKWIRQQKPEWKKLDVREHTVKRSPAHWLEEFSSAVSGATRLLTSHGGLLSVHSM